MSKSYQIIIIVFVFFSQVQNSILIPKITRSDEVSDEEVSLEEEVLIRRGKSVNESRTILKNYNENQQFDSEEEVLKRGESVNKNRHILRNYNQNQQFDKDVNKVGGTLIIEGLNSFIFLPNDETLSDHVPTCKPGDPGCSRPISFGRPPAIPTPRPTNPTREATISSHRPTSSAHPPAIYAQKPPPIITHKPNGIELGEPSCNPKGFLAFLGMVPIGCSPSSPDNFSQLDSLSKSMESCSHSKMNQPKQAVSRMGPMSPKSRSPELPIYAESRNTLWDDYDGLKPKNKDPLENMWNMKNGLSPMIKHKVDENLLRKMYKKYVDNENTARHRR